MSSKHPQEFNRLPLSLALMSTVFVSSITMISPKVLAQTQIKPLEEVVVTARRRSESLQDVPIAVTALSGDELAIRGAQDITDIAQSTPSVTLEASRGTSSTLTAFIRGVGQQDPLPGFEQGVALYLDDVYIARPQAALLDIYDVERVEVLRGPQGTLYGRNAVGGAIKYVTKRLADEPSVRVKATAGTYNQQDIVIAGSAPITPDFKVGATVANLTRDGFGENLTTGEENYNKDIFAYRLSAEYTPFDEGYFRLSYDKTQDDTDPVAGHRPRAGAVSGAPVLGDVRDTTAGISESPSSAGINGNNEIEAEGYSFSLRVPLTDTLSLKFIHAQREDATESVIDFDSLAVQDLDVTVIYENEQLSEEIQLLFDNGTVSAVTGFYYLDATAESTFDTVLGQLGLLEDGVPLTAFSEGQVDTEAYSVFSDVTINLSTAFSVSFGARYTRDKREADVLRETYVGIGSPAFGNDAAILAATTSDYTADRTFQDFSPRVNVSFSPTDDLNLYASYSQGWKAGSFDPRGANFSTNEVEDGFDAENLDSYEFGVKATWLGGIARTNVALFYSDYQDLQIPGSIGVDTDDDGVNDTFVGAVTNAGKAEIRGVEFESLFAITDNLSAQFTFSLLDAEITEWIVNGEDVSDSREIQNTPNSTAYLGLNYAQELDIGSFNYNVNWSYRDDVTQFEIPAPDLDQEAYSLYNASVVWTSPDQHWTLGLHGKNLTDEEIKTSGYCFGIEGCPSALGLEDNTTVFYAPPRTFSGSVEYYF